MQNLMEGIYDMHVHTAPDIRERAYTDFQLLEAGVRVQAKGIVLKSHWGSTAERAFLCNEYNKKVYGKTNDFTMYGSITLNNGVGGINPDAVETALKLGARVVWLPTIHAENHIKKKGGSQTGIKIFSDEGRLLESVKTVLQLIKEHHAVIGTGHLSGLEIFSFVKQARELEVQKIVVTHPEFWLVGLTEREQIQLVNDYDVILERNYAQPLLQGGYKKNLEDNLSIIKKLGSKNIMVDTDGGQVENPHWELALEEYVNYLFNGGISLDAINHMTKKLPEYLLEGQV